MENESSPPEVASPKTRVTIELPAEARERLLSDPARYIAALKEAGFDVLSIEAADEREEA